MRSLYRRCCCQRGASGLRQPTQPIPGAIASEPALAANNPPVTSALWRGRLLSLALLFANGCFLTFFLCVIQIMGYNTRFLGRTVGRQVAFFSEISSMTGGDYCCSFGGFDSLAIEHVRSHSICCLKANINITITFQIINFRKFLFLILEPHSRLGDK